MADHSNSNKYIWQTNLRLMKLGLPTWTICILGTIFIGLFNYVLNLSIGLMMSHTITIVQKGESPTSDLVKILVLVAGFTIIACIGYILNSKGAFQIRVSIQKRMLTKLVNQKEEESSQKHSGDIMTIVTTDMEAVEEYFFQGFLFTFLLPCVSGVAAAVTLCVINWRFLLTSVVIGIIPLLLTVIYSKKLQTTSRKVRTVASQMTMTYEEVIGGNITHRMAGTVPEAEAGFQESSNQYRMAKTTEGMFQNLMEKIQELLFVFSELLFLLLGVYLSSMGKMEFSSVLIAMAMQSTVTGMLGSFSSIWKFMVSQSTAAERVLQVLELSGEEKREEKKDIFPPSEDKTLCFQDVHFSYQEGMPIIQNTSFTVQGKGGNYVLVGDSGSGKSTILKLLLQFYTPKSGDMKIDNISYQDCSLSSWRKQFAYIPQDASLISRSVFDNIAIGAYGEGRTPSQEEVEEAARKAGAHEFITHLPQGYETIIAENGGNLSGGQKQRIAIARAFLSNAPIFLLDEPTAALDAESEQVIQNSLNNLAKEKLLLTIAHKLETIQNADCVLDMNELNVLSY